MSWLAAGNYPLNRPTLSTREEHVEMLSRTNTMTIGKCGGRILLGEAYHAIPVGGGLGPHPPTLNHPRRTVADHHLPTVPLNSGLSDDLYAARTVTNVLSSLGSDRDDRRFYSSI